MAIGKLSVEWDRKPILLILVTFDLQESVLKDRIYDVPVVIDVAQMYTIARVLENSVYCLRYKVMYLGDEQYIEPEHFGFEANDFPKWTVNYLV